MINFILGVSVTLNFVMSIFIYLYLKIDSKSDNNIFNDFFEQSFKKGDFK